MNNDKKFIDSTDDEDQEDADSLGSKPWKRFFGSTPGQVICDERSEARIHLYMTLIFLGVAYYIFGAMPFGESRDDIFIYAVRSLFPALAVVFLVLGVRAYVRNKKFGTSLFQIKNETGVLGGTLSGTIQSSVEIAPKGNYSILLECLQKKVSEGAGDRSSTKHVCLWKEKSSLSPTGISSRVGIPVHFSIPSNLPSSNFLSGDGHIQWILRISAPTPGLNYKAAFVVPVFSKPFKS